VKKIGQRELSGYEERAKGLYIDKRTIFERIKEIKSENEKSRSTK
jgi:hypothetical protein